MAAWEDYRSCCRVTAARDRAAGFCPECGHRLFRCPAPDCGSLLPPLGHCPDCVSPRLSLEKGAVLTARLGECLSVPLVLGNESRLRPLSVRSIFREGAGAAEEAVPLTWEGLEAGRTRTFSVGAGPFANAGRQSLHLTIVIAAGFGDVEEKYAFTGEVAIDVEGKDPTQVVQHFNLAGADFGTAGMVVANPHASGERRRQDDALDRRTDIVLERAERFEIQRGLRGYGEERARIPRDVEFQFAGFPPGDVPPNGPLVTGVLRCGRNGRPKDGSQTGQPNDLCLRIYDPRTGTLDREASAGISRHVCDFLIQDDRLMVRAATDVGLAFNGQKLAAGDRRVVEHGDGATVNAAPGKTLGFTATLKVAGAVITHVRFDKTV
jgi:hypothetical protein